MLKKILKILLYISYGLILALLIICWKFPFDALEERIQFEVNQQSPLRISKPELAFSLPLKLTAQNIAFFPQEKDKPALLDLASIDITADPWALIKGALGLNIKSSLYAGELTGKIQTKSLSLPAETSIKLNWHDLDTQKYPYISVSPFFELQGTLSGELSYTGKLDDFSKISGRGNVACQGLTAQVNVPFVQIKEIENLLLKGDYSLAAQKLQIEGGQLANEMLEANLAGDLRFANNVMRSPLNLKGKIKISPDLVNMGTTTPKMARYMRKQQFIPFRIYGTLGGTKFDVF